MSLPTLRQLQYLMAVVELCHFGRAAERCFVTQSTLSTGIKELESLLGGRLVERTKRRVIPTTLGRAVAEKARQMMALTEEMQQLVQADAVPLSGRFDLGVIPTIGPFLLPKVLPGLRQEYPQLELYLVEDQTDGLIQRLLNGELDVAILALPYALERLDHRVFWQENFLVAFPSRHALRKKKVLQADDLPLDELLLLQEGHCLRDHALSACHLLGKGQGNAFQGTSLYTLMQMVVSGLGVTFIPEMAVDADFLRQREIAVRPLQEPGPHRELALVWRGSSHKVEEFILLAESIKARLQAVMA